ncbi:hypothetical protein O0I10_012127 [Lichtheimia ornata]|uniref:Mak10-domain-containing protein n=1 Tax=Lichtheimia ornata TaxID=688661 RepID=A0AAD7UU08_9FUNG|nr:uncharacterized protein O0I10_012127 [Lichtheimia ornata]KAJ8652271.1 hypothetical protein O0I10_012127 [Lichtheimia ornata]
MEDVSDIREAISDLSINVPGATPQDDVDQNFMAPPWKDITSFLDEATNDFQVGQLMHLRSFTLFDAMSAIEVMDPKMDTGMAIGDSTPFDIKQPLDARQILWIMDRLLSCEMGWLSGHSLAQTVYTCIYFHHIHALASEESWPDALRTALKAYLFGAIKCCYYIWIEMTACNVYEEEDFTTNLFGLSLYEQYTDSYVMNLLDVAIMQLRNNVDNNPITNSLVNRLVMRRSYFLALTYLAQPRCQGLSPAHAELDKVLSLLKATDDEAVSMTIGKGEPVEGAFDPNINRKLTSQAPPRPITLQTEEEAYKSYRELIERLQLVCSVTNYPSVRSLLTFFEMFGATRPYADAFSRSKLNSLLYHDNRVFGLEPPVRWICKAIDEISKPPDWILRPDSRSPPKGVDEQALSEARTMLGGFLDGAALPFVDLFKIQCHNRSRQRRILSKLLPEWEMLQEEATVVDNMIHKAVPFREAPYYFSKWVYHVKVGMLEKILLLGFELELYGSHEYAIIYIYLQHLNITQHALLNSLDVEIIRQLDSDKGKKMDDELRRSMHAQQYINYRRIFNRLYQNLSSGTYKLLMFLQKKTQQLEVLSPRFDDPETRYNHRFKSFMKLSSPQPLSYDAVKDALDVHAIDKSVLINGAYQDFTLAKSILGKVTSDLLETSSTEMCRDAYLKDINAMMRTCVANLIIITQLSDDKNLEKKACINFKYHPWWPVFELTT